MTEVVTELLKIGPVQISNPASNVLLIQGTGDNKTTSVHLHPGPGAQPAHTITEYVLMQTPGQAFGGNYARWSFTCFGVALGNCFGLYGEFGGANAPKPFIANVGYEVTPGVFQSYEYWRLADAPNLGCTIYGLSQPPKDIIQLIPEWPTSGAKNSHALLWQGWFNNGTLHNVQWRARVEVAADGKSKLVFMSGIDGAMQTRFAIGDDGTLYVKKIEMI